MVAVPHVEAAGRAGGHAAVRVWLVCIAVLIAAMVLVGGATRLTDSGLSITEWQPILGVIPPLNEADWQTALELYRQIPEYQLINRGMSLEEFKFIYWWEWAHRFLGRFVGLAFFVPLLVFWIRGQLDGPLKWRLVTVLALGGLQGALGWYMVMSGLAERVDVSQYRLAAHLGLAVALFGYVVWLVLRLGAPAPFAATWRWSAHSLAALSVVALIFAQIIAGGFVAGLDAGQGYNTWPLMDGRFVPKGLFVMAPAWINLFENAMTVQFVHRIGAYLVTLAAIALIVQSLRADPGPARISALVLAAAVAVQVALGIATLLAQVPIGLALWHQMAALAVLAAGLYHLHVTAFGGDEKSPA